MRPSSAWKGPEKGAYWPSFFGLFRPIVLPHSLFSAALVFRDPTSGRVCIDTCLPCSRARAVGLEAARWLEVGNVLCLYYLWFLMFG